VTAIMRVGHTCNRPSTRSSIGLSLMRGVPSRTKFPWPAHSTPARGLIAVPAFPIKKNFELKKKSHFMSMSRLLLCYVEGLNIAFRSLYAHKLSTTTLPSDNSSLSTLIAPPRPVMTAVFFSLSSTTGI
jgi:hypothetical protein